MKITKLISTIIVIICCIILITSCDLIEKLSGSTHTHEWATDWQSDENNHYRVCLTDECGERTANAEHSWGEPVVLVKPSIGKPGKNEYKCTVCERVKTEIVPALDHMHIAKPGYISNETHHWYECSQDGCEEKLQLTIHSWDEGTVITEATSGNKGLIRHTCYHCMATKLEDIPALPEKMPIDEWEKLFDIDNVRIDAVMDVSGLAKITMTTLIDGEYASVTSEGETYYSTAEEELSQIDFADSYNKFNHIGKNVYFASEALIESEEMDLEITDVTVTVKDGKIYSVSYTMDILGINAKIDFSLSEWGEVVVDIPVLNDSAYETILNPDNYYNYSLDVNMFDADFNGYSATYVFDGDEYGIFFDGSEAQYGTEENAGMTLNPIIILLGALSADDFTFDATLGGFSCTSEFLEECGYTSLTISIESGYIISAYATETSGWEYYYDFYAYGESELGEEDTEIPVLDEEAYTAILDTDKYLNYTFTRINFDEEGNAYVTSYIIDGDSYIYVNEDGEANNVELENAGIQLHPILHVLKDAKYEDFVYEETTGGFICTSSDVVDNVFVSIIIVIEDGYLVSAYADRGALGVFYYEFYDYGTSGTSGEGALTLDANTYSEIINDENYSNYTLDTYFEDQNGNYYGSVCIFDGDRYSVTPFDENGIGETQYVDLPGAGIMSNAALPILKMLKADDFVYVPAVEAFVCKSDILTTYGIEYLEIMTDENGMLAYVYFESSTENIEQYNFYDYGVSVVS